MSSIVTRGTAILLTAIWFGASVRPAGADANSSPVTSKRMAFVEQTGRLTVSTSFPEIFDRSRARQLSNGRVMTIVMRAYVFKTQERLPVSLIVATFRCVYDLWDEIYTLRINGPLGTKSVRFSRRSDAINAMTTLTRFPIAPLSRLGIGPHYFLALVIEINPVSADFLAEVRRWMSLPTSEARQLSASSTFFGSFVSIFHNPKIPEADAVFQLQSQPFYRTP